MWNHRYFINFFLFHIDRYGRNRSIFCRICCIGLCWIANIGNVSLSLNTQSWNRVRKTSFVAPDVIVKAGVMSWGFSSEIFSTVLKCFDAKYTFLGSAPRNVGDSSFSMPRYIAPPAVYRAKDIFEKSAVSSGFWFGEIYNVTITTIVSLFLSYIRQHEFRRPESFLNY